MLARRIIPCLDVRDGKVVKGVAFKNHTIAGDILPLARFYSQSGADELVFYDITASCEARSVSTQWVEQIATEIHIPFCVAGGITSLARAEAILKAGADKISLNTPALQHPELITDIANMFGVQCVVIGIDSQQQRDGSYRVWQSTGSEKTARTTDWDTMSWITEVQKRGAGEIVLNCMNRDGMRQGYDIAQLQQARQHTSVPLIASGGAGSMQHFAQLFNAVHVDGALAASVFHHRTVSIGDLKALLTQHHIPIRPISSHLHLTAPFTADHKTKGP